MKLPYKERLYSVRLFLRREYPRLFKNFNEVVWVRLEDLTETEVQKQLALGIDTDGVVAASIVMAVIDLASQVRAGVGMASEEVLKVAERFNEKRGDVS